MDLVTKAEFARRHEVSKPAVQKWESQGFLVFRDGKVDVEASDAKLRGARLGRFKDAVNQPAAVNSPVNPVNPPPPVNPDDTEALEDFLERLLAGQYATQADAERVKENVLAAKHLLAVRKEAGALVEVEQAETILFEVSRAARDAWLNWPVRVGPLLAAELGLEADRVTEVLTKHVHQHLDELGEPEAEFAGQG